MIGELAHTFEINKHSEIVCSYSKFDRKSVHMLISTKTKRFTASFASLMSISGEWLRFSNRKKHSMRFVWSEIPSVEMINDPRHAALVLSERDVTLSR